MTRCPGFGGRVRITGGSASPAHSAAYRTRDGQNGNFAHPFIYRADGAAAQGTVLAPAANDGEAAADPDRPGAAPF